MTVAILPEGNKRKSTTMKTVALVVSVLALSASAASAEWKLGKSQHEPCWSIANPVRCDGTYRPHNPDVFALFVRDPAAAQSYWRQR
jgi:hypothetical protein